MRLAGYLLPIGLLASACGGGDGGERGDGGASSAAPGGAGAVDTTALRSGVPHPPPARAPRGTPRPDSLASVGDADDSAGLTPVTPPPADDLRVMPWSMLTQHAEQLLRDLASRQEERFADEGRYSAEAPAGREGWTVRVLFADEEAWAAEATQAFHPGRSCVAWGGNAGGRRPRTALAGRSAGAGTPACDPGD